jgi:hypothetical protein
MESRQARSQERFTGGIVRKLFTLTLASGAVFAMACGKSKSPSSTSMNADLQRDLQLAAANQNIRINPDEISPSSKQELALAPKKAPQGNKVIRTEHPTVKASATPAQVAEIKTELPQQVQVMASAPAPSETPAPDAPPMARPAAVPAVNYPSSGPGPNSGSGNGNGSGSGSAGGILGGIFGGIMRGGDDDHCEPRGPRRTGRPVGGDVFGGVYGRPGGMPTGTRPIGGRYP